MAALGPPMPAVACNDAELADARWFSRSWLAAVLSGEEPINVVMYAFVLFGAC